LEGELVDGAAAIHVDQKRRSLHRSQRCLVDEAVGGRLGGQRHNYHVAPRDQLMQVVRLIEARGSVPSGSPVPG
jgi:hypothetical protein